MKLIFCRECFDLFRLLESLEPRRCQCGKSGGKYIDRLNAEVSGPCTVLGIVNNGFMRAVYNQSTLEQAGFGGVEEGQEFPAFVIPSGCKTVRRVE